jgi:hypothetical protein
MQKFIKIGAAGYGKSWGKTYYVVDGRGGHVKLASGECAPKFHPRIEQYLATTTFTPNDLALVVVPLGSFETWGNNVNGDSFQRKWLEPENPDWGHKSFEVHAHAYQHHQNKIVERSFGTVPVAVYEGLMHRVECVYQLDREKAERVDAGWAIKKFDRGEQVDLSMGANVPFDICSICGHESKSTTEYCSHLREHMAEILPDGRVTCAHNPRPKFFDLSCVLVKAAKEAWILQKMASAGLIKDHEIRQLLENYKPAPGGQALQKVAGIKGAGTKLADEKLAEIEKQAPVVYSKVVHPLYRTEQPLPDSLLDFMSRFDLPSSLSSAATTGIVLRPREFQYLFLNQMGKPDLAARLHGQCRVFAHPTEKFVPPDMFGCGGSPRWMMSSDHALPEILQRLMDIVPQRSCLQPFIGKRIIVMISGGGQKKLEPDLTEVPGMDDVSSAYAKYIHGLATGLPSLLEHSMAKHGEVFDTFAAASFEPAQKMASFKGDVLVPALGVVLPTYLLSNKWAEDKMAGEDLGMIRSFIAAHPVLSIIGALTGYRALGLHNVVDRLAQKPIAAVVRGV